MRIVRPILAVVLAVLFIAPAAQAQNHAVAKAALDSALHERLSRDDDDRQAILALLERPEVQQIAAQAGLPLEKAKLAVAMLEGQDLRDLASEARGAQTDLAGGASAVVISTTTIIIVLLLVILIVVLVD